MKTPENLVQAVSRLNPQAILLLDTNTIMEYPMLASDRLAGTGPFLLVLPEIVINEQLGLTFNVDAKKKSKATSVKKSLGELLSRGTPAAGIDLKNGNWTITASAPRPTGNLEDEQAFKYLGQVDAALLRLADACAAEFPEVRTALVTRDKNLTHIARARGRAVCPWSELKKPETLDKLFVADIYPDIGVELEPLLGDRQVTITITLEELKSDDEYLVAGGTGQIRELDESYPFRWTYPCKNAAHAADPESLIQMMQAGSPMPLDNVDFFGKHEKIPYEVRQRIRAMLEEFGAGDNASMSPAESWYDREPLPALDMVDIVIEGTMTSWHDTWESGFYCLQTPLARIRLAVIYLEYWLWGYSPLLDPAVLSSLVETKSHEQADKIKRLYSRYDDAILRILHHSVTTIPSNQDVGAALSPRVEAMIAHREGRPVDPGAFEKANQAYESLFDRHSIGAAYLKAFRCYKELAESLGYPVQNMEVGLKWLLDVASDSWSVGETREEDFTYKLLPQEN